MIFIFTKGWRAKFKASAGHIWPAGRMLCMPVLDYACQPYICVATCNDLSKSYVNTKNLIKET